MYYREKDLAISSSFEANELLENFQWRTSEEAIAESNQNINEEMADIYIYILCNLLTGWRYILKMKFQKNWLRTLLNIQK